MSTRTGIGAEAISQYAFAAGQSGTSLESFGRGVQKMNKFLDEARTGSKVTTETLDRLGISVSQFDNLDGDKQFELFADRIAAIEDPGTKAALAMQVFGKGAVDLLPLMANGSAGIRELRDDADRLGMTMTDVAAAKAAQLNDSLDRMTSSTKALVNEFAAQLAPVVTTTANAMAYFVGSNQDWIRTAITVVSAIGVFAVAMKTITLAQQLYAKAAAVAQALSGPKGWFVLATGVAAAAYATSQLTREFEESNAQMANAQAAAESTADGMDRLAGATQRANAALGAGSDSLSKFRNPGINNEELDAYALAARNASEQLEAIRTQRAELSTKFYAQGGMGGDITGAMLEDLAVREKIAAQTAKAANALYGNKFYEANAANRQTLPDNAPEYMKAARNPDLPTAKFDSESLNQYRRDAERAVEQLEAVRAKRAELTVEFKSQGGMGGRITADQIEGIAAQEAAAYRAAKAASEFAAAKISESTNAALLLQAKSAAEFASNVTTLKASLLTNAEASKAEFQKVFDAWAGAGSATKVRYEEMAALQAKFAENKSGFTDQFTSLSTELRILRGEITATELEFENLASFGVSDQQIQTLKELRAERDGLQKDLDQQAERKQQSDEKIKSLTATRDNVLESLMTPVETALAEFKSKASEVNAAVAAGLLDPAKAVEYLANEQKRLTEGFVGEKFKQASNNGIDAKSQQANDMLVDLANRRGGPQPDSKSDQQTELQRQIAREAQRTANEIAGMRLEAARREQMTTKPFNQKSGANG